MNRDRKSRKRGSWDSSRKQQSSYAQKKQFYAPKAVTEEQIRAEEKAIEAFKSSKKILCARCHEVITDIASAVQDRELNEPIHFDCALEQISNAERLLEGEKIAYIGQGRFGIISYANPRDIKHFTIKKINER